MTSFGIEWETQALIFLPEYELPEGIVSKSPAITGENWSLSFEYINMPEVRTGVYKREDETIDCFYNIEAQLGVFKSEKEKIFNIKSFMKSCFLFGQMWKQMVATKSLTLKGKEYDILSYAYGSKLDPSKCFKDCARTDPGILRRTKNRRNLEWAYINDISTVRGKPQLTIGIKLKYVLKLFNQYTYYITECFKDKTKCSTIPKYDLAFVIGDAYFKTKEQLHRLKIDGSDKFISLIILCNYFILLKIRPQSKTYFKATFHIKPRTNYRFMYQMLDDNEQDLFLIWAADIANTPEYVGFYKWFNQIIKPDQKAYILSPKPGEKIKLNTTKLAIYSIPKNKYSEIEKYANIRKVYYDNMTSLERKPRQINILYDSDGTPTIVEGKIGIDIGEWIPDGDIVHFELRSIETILALLDSELYDGEYRELPSSETKGMMSHSDLCVKINIVIMKFLNTMFDRELM
jgi:hypothetical protein